MVNPAAELDKAIKRLGSQTAVAKLAGVSIAYINDIKQGRRDIGGAASVLDALGIEKVVTYKRKAKP
jgi:DNA-binding transcriptional regulator YdaS (Cro superfamily)